MRVQDALGLMQDARVAAAKLLELATAEGSTLSPMTVFVMGGITERYRHESEKLARKVPALLGELRGAEWQKLTALMERRRLELGAQYRWPGAAPTAPLATRVVPGAEPAPPALSSDPVPPVADPEAATASSVPPDPTATHPAASRGGSARLVPSARSSEPGTGRDSGPVPDAPVFGQSSNSGGPPR